MNVAEEEEDTFRRGMDKKGTEGGGGKKGGGKGDGASSSLRDCAKRRKDPSPAFQCTIAAADAK